MIINGIVETSSPTSGAVRMPAIADSAPPIIHPKAASAAGDVCADATAVESAVTDLKGLDLKSVGKSGLTAAIETLETSATALAASAKETAGPEAQALSTAVAALRTTVDGLTSDASVAEKATDVQTAVTGVESSAQALKAKLTQCS